MNVNEYIKNTVIRVFGAISYNTSTQSLGVFWTVDRSIKSCMVKVGFIKYLNEKKKKVILL